MRASDADREVVRAVLVEDLAILAGRREVRGKAVMTIG